MNENENIIEIITKHTRVLLLNHWPDISDFRNGAESIKIGFSHDVAYEGQERIIETTISFGKRVKDSTVDRLDTDQMNLDLTHKNQEPKPAAASIKKRGRPPKNVSRLTAAFPHSAPPSLTA